MKPGTIIGNIWRMLFLSFCIFCVDMRRLLITSGPTREYLDPVRFLTNGSSGRMGAALADAAVELGWEVIVISGPVSVPYPQAVEQYHVISTQEMFDASLLVFPECDAVIGAAAPCDYRPKEFSEKKICKCEFNGTLDLIETPDILAALGRLKRKEQKIIAFALETHNSRENAIRKMQRKNADWIVLNGPRAIEAEQSSVEILDHNGDSLGPLSTSKTVIAKRLLQLIS